MYLLSYDLSIKAVTNKLKKQYYTGKVGKGGVNHKTENKAVTNLSFYQTKN